MSTFYIFAKLIILCQRPLKQYSFSNEVNMGLGDNIFIVKESSGLHILEVDNSGSTGESQGWAWNEVVCLILAITLGLILTAV